MIRGGNREHSACFTRGQLSVLQDSNVNALPPSPAAGSATLSATRPAARLAHRPACCEPVEAGVQPCPRTTPSPPAPPSGDHSSW